MRITILLPLTALVAVAAGCESEGREQAAGSVPQRDLTLVTHPARVEIASSVEMQQPKRTARPARAPRSSPREAKVVVIAAPETVTQPTSTAPTLANDRELLPGETVTLIPASNGPTTGPDEANDLPAARGRTMGGRGGGRCRGGGRGPGIGIAAAPRPDFR
jgi:hypothetical protein